MMPLLTACLVIGLLPALIAKWKGRSFLLWWIYGAALFLVALPHSLLMRSRATPALRTCPHCAEDIRAEARVCKHCGRDVAETGGFAAAADLAARNAPTQNPLAREVTWRDAVVLTGLAGLFVGACWFYGCFHSDQHESNGSPQASAQSGNITSDTAAAATPAPDADLQVRKWSWHEEYGFAIAEGTVKNLGGEPLTNVEAVVSFKTSGGEFISSEDALIEFDPLMPGQTSPWKVHARWNPAMRNASLQFKEMNGRELSAIGK